MWSPRKQVIQTPKPTKAVEVKGGYSDSDEITLTEALKD
jgi:hypothetical protein